MHVSRYDPNNPSHLACTEVRKANLANCQFLTNMMRADAGVAVKAQQAACVRSKAIESLVRTKFMREAVAVRVVDEVFDRCYADLEPIGRRAKWVFLLVCFCHHILFVSGTPRIFRRPLMKNFSLATDGANARHDLLEESIGCANYLFC
jgi:hypothetical protein